MTEDSFNEMISFLKNQKEVKYVDEISLAIQNSLSDVNKIDCKVNIDLPNSNLNQNVPKINKSDLFFL
jgi:acetamidase/formamidase